VEAFFALPASSACPGAGVSQAEWKRFLAQAIRKVQTRPLVPALIYRLLRCAPEDEAAIGHLLDYVGSFPAEPDSAFHVPLYAHIVLSELWDLTPLSVAEYAASDQSLLIAPGNTDYFQALWEEWPRTPEDALANQTASPTTPVLLLQGGLDPQTSKLAADPFASALEAQGHSYVVFPDAPHAVIGQTPIAGNPTEQCADLLVRAFIADPSVTSHSCQAELAPLDFGDNVELAAEALGTGSIWENVPVPAGLTERSASRRDIRRALLQLAAHGLTH
jgi:pimeloyl-ACP methyl ester carboxylesterase